MAGCVKVSRYFTASNVQKPANYNDEHETTMMLSKLTQQTEALAQAVICAARQNVIERRGDILAKFQQLKEAVDTAARSALAELVAAAQNDVKALELEAEAAKVKMFQIAARINAGADLDGVSSEMDGIYRWLNQLAVPTHVFNDAGIQVLCDLLSEISNISWSFLSFKESVDAAVVDRAQCALLAEMHQFLMQSKEEFGREILHKHFCVMTAATTESTSLFQNQLLATRPIPDVGSTGGFVASTNGLVALMDPNYNEHGFGARVVSAITGDIISAFGLPENRHFIIKSSLRFVANTTNLLIAEPLGHRIQDVFKS